MKVFLFAAAACLAAAGCSRDPLRPLGVFAGSWEGVHRVAGDGTGYAAIYEIRREGDALVWEFRSDWAGGFSGRGVTRWDRAAGGLVETWTDSRQAGETATRGGWDPATATMTMRGDGPDWETGETIPFAHRTRLDGGDSWSYVMTAERAGGAEEVVWIVMRRR